MIRILSLFIVAYYSISSVFAQGQGSFLGKNKIISNIKGSESPLADVIEKYMVWMLSFLFFVSVVIGIYAGFTILTAKGDDEQVTKGKKIFFMAVGGIVIIFMAGMISSFFIYMFSHDKLEPNTNSGSTVITL